MSAAYQSLGRILVIIPTYNEIDNIDIAVAAVRVATPDIDVLVADDNSPDGTGVRANEIAAVDHHVKVLHRTVKEGLGAAYIASFQWAKQQGYEVK